MESFYWRYNHSIRPYIIIGLFYVFTSCGHLYSQVPDQFNKSIENFLSSDYITLLQKVKDYQNIGNVSLKNAISSEIQNLSISINPNAIIEYEKTLSQNGEELIISDKILPFLINYAGKSFNYAKAVNQCNININGDYHAYFYSTGIVSNGDVLRKAIFKLSNNTIELRRISYANSIPEECSSRTTTTSIVSSPIPELRTPIKKKSTLPRITIKQVEDHNGQAVIYGFIINHKGNGILIDQNTGAEIGVSDRDGFFYMSRLMGSNSYLNLHFRYDYGQKFIMDKKLVFIP